MQNENESLTNTPLRQFKNTKQPAPAIINNPDVKRVKYLEQTAGELQSSPTEEQSNSHQSAATTAFSM
jgi:hypothetical protein